MEDTGLEPLTSCMPWTKANRLSATKPTSNAYLTKSPSICKITHVSAKVCKECVYFRVQVCSKCVVVIVSVRWSPDGQNLAPDIGSVSVATLDPWVPGPPATGCHGAKAERRSPSRAVFPLHIIEDAVGLNHLA